MRFAKKCIDDVGSLEILDAAGSCERFLKNRLRVMSLERDIMAFISRCAKVNLILTLLRSIRSYVWERLQFDSRILRFIEAGKNKAY